MKNPDARKVCAVVVTYLPDTGALRSLLRALLAQTASVIVIDNTPAPDSRVEILCKEGGFGDIDLVRLGSNQGIARALNVGIATALDHGATHVLLSDQDSLPAHDMVAQLLRAYAELVDRGESVGAVGPTFTDRNTGRTFPFQADISGNFFYGHLLPDEQHPHVKAISLITSGSLVSAQALRAVGPMREDFFIDNVDVEWCHRAQAAGFSLYGVGAAAMFHALGNHAFRVWYFGWRNVSAYSSLRVYYSIRNFVALCRMPIINWRWKLRNGWYSAGVVYSHAVFGSDRRSAIYMALRGLFDGLRGRMGSWRQ